MNTQDQINYNRIAAAIEYLKSNFREQPNLDKVAEKVHLSPFHFQRLFTEWAGTSPKKFLQYISLQHAKYLLQKNQPLNLFDTAMDTGLSGTSRLHDLFVKIEGMTPAEYKNGGRNLTISYSFAPSPFGNIIIASTARGLSHMAFFENKIQAVNELKNAFPAAGLIEKCVPLHQDVMGFFQRDWSQINQIKLHVRGTDFQLKVWEALLKIPMGHLDTYGNIAMKINQPNASRAVGTAIGSNPVALLIPCHRVIQATGHIGGYRWGNTRKTAMIGWEGATTHS